MEKQIFHNELGYTDNKQLRLLGISLICLEGARLQLEGKFSKCIIHNELDCLREAIKNLEELYNATN